MKFDNEKICAKCHTCICESCCPDEINNRPIRDVFKVCVKCLYKQYHILQVSKSNVATKILLCTDDDHTNLSTQEIETILKSRVFIDPNIGKYLSFRFSDVFKFLRNIFEVDCLYSDFDYDESDHEI